MFLSWFHFSRFSTHSRFCRPRRPMPLKSVLGSFPWKPISHHCFEMRPERGESGRSSFHSWWVKRYLRKASLLEKILLWPRGFATLWMVATYIYLLETVIKSLATANCELLIIPSWASPHVLGFHSHTALYAASPPPLLGFDNPQSGAGKPGERCQVWKKNINTAYALKK